MPVQIVGDCTPSIVYRPEVANILYKYFPQGKLILLMRDPVERAFSHYKYSYLDRKKTFNEMVVEQIDTIESGKTSGDVQMLKRGFYGEQLERFTTNLFIPSQIHILCSKIISHTLDYSATFEFLGVPPMRIDAEQYNVASTVTPAETPKRFAVGAFNDSTSFSQDSIAMEPATKERLKAFYAPYNERLLQWLKRVRDKRRKN